MGHHDGSCNTLGVRVKGEYMTTTSFDDSPLWELPPAERALLAQRLWDSVRAETYAAPFTPEQIAEINRRIAQADAGEVELIPWEDVRDKFLSAK